MVSSPRISFSTLWISYMGCGSIWPCTLVSMLNLYMVLVALQRSSPTGIRGDQEGLVASSAVSAMDGQVIIKLRKLFLTYVFWVLVRLTYVLLLFQPLDGVTSA